MYTLQNTYEGAPPRLYRSTDEVRRDMLIISGKIKNTEEMLSVHNLLIEMIPTWAEADPAKWIPELKQTLEEADEALENLRKLKAALEELRLELEEVQCMLKK